MTTAQVERAALYELVRLLGAVDPTDRPALEDARRRLAEGANPSAGAVLARIALDTQLGGEIDRRALDGLGIEPGRAALLLWRGLELVSGPRKRPEPPAPGEDPPGAVEAILGPPRR